MAGVAVYEDDVKILGLEVAGEVSDEFEAAGAAADDDYLGFAAIGSGAGHRGAFRGVLCVSQAGSWTAAAKRLEPRYEHYHHAPDCC